MERGQGSKRNDNQLVGIEGDTPKGKPGKSVKNLNEQIKENEQALLKLLEQAGRCVESSESSEDDKYKASQKKKSLGRKNKLKQTINKVCSKLNEE